MVRRQPGDCLDHREMLDPSAELEVAVIDEIRCSTTRTGAWADPAKVGANAARVWLVGARCRPEPAVVALADAWACPGNRRKQRKHLGQVGEAIAGRRARRRGRGTPSSSFSRRGAQPAGRLPRQVGGVHLRCPVAPRCASNFRFAGGDDILVATDAMGWASTCSGGWCSPYPEVRRRPSGYTRRRCSRRID